MIQAVAAHPSDQLQIVSGLSLLLQRLSVILYSYHNLLLGKLYFDTLLVRYPISLVWSVKNSHWHTCIQTNMP